MTTGYSDTPLGQKLGYKNGMHAWFGLRFMLRKNAR